VARFTASVPLNIKWNGNELVGASGATHRIPDALVDEFTAAFGSSIPGLSWVTQDETTTFLTTPIAQTDVTGLTAALAAKYPTTGGTIEGAVTVTGALVAQAAATVAGALTAQGALTVVGAATLSSTVNAPDIGGVIYADRYTSLAAALTAGAGGEVFIPEGTYALSSSLQPASNTRIRGAGPGTVLTMSGNLPIIQCAASASGVVVEGLRLVGSATTASTLLRGVYAPDGCSNITFRNLLIESCFRGVSVSGTTTALVSNVRVISDKTTTGGGIDVNGSYYVRVESCQVESPNLHGIDFREGGGYHKAINCTVLSAGSTGFVISGSSGTGVSLPGCEFIGCSSIVAGVTETASGCGFIVENGAQFSRVVGCYSSAPALHGFHVATGTGDRPSATVISGCISRAAGSRGINMQDSGAVTVTGCEVSNAAGEGIKTNGTHATLNHASIVGCTARACGTTSLPAISVTGTGEGTIVSGCYALQAPGIGISVDAPRTIVQGCNVIDADNGGALTIGGITLTTNADRSTVTGCASFRTSGTKQDYGVDVQSGCTSAVVVGNILATNTTGGLLNNGTTTSSANNIES
jgi:nitrous oxidase accessory protein NosD